MKTAICWLNASLPCIISKISYNILGGIVNKKIHNKFNSIMMRLFSYKEIVTEMMLYLVGENWVKLIDFDSLKEVSKDFTSPEELDDFQSDMLWSVKLKNSNKKFYIYIHVEFQSTPHRLMPFRFLNYQYLIYDRIINQIKERKNTDLLPFIFPILFYHGKNKWNFETDISKLIEIPFDKAKNYIPKFNFFKIMINEKTYEELSKHESVLANNFACNNVKSKEDFINSILRVSRLLYDLIPKEHKLNLSKDLAKYLSFISNDRIPTSKIIDILNIYEEDKMTIAEILDKERIEGRVEGKIETAKKMLKEKVDIAFISKITDLSIEKINELQQEMENKN